jgi:hypothetical protein
MPFATVSIDTAIDFRPATVLDITRELRLVLDTNALVAASRSDQGASRQLFLAALDRRVVVGASASLMLEYEALPLNQLINVAVAERISALRTAEYFRERSARADIDRSKRILKRAGWGPSPAVGDSL